MSGLSDDWKFYIDCLGLWDIALASAYGIRIKCSSNGTALRLRTRLHKARAMAREETKTMSKGKSIASTYDCMWIAVAKNIVLIIHDVPSEVKPELRIVDTVAPIEGVKEPKPFSVIDVKEPELSDVLAEVIPKFKRRF